MSVRLDQVIPWGRTFDEYRRMFDLSAGDLAGRILGCGDGPASFNAEATARGRRVVSCDPVYVFDGAAIRRRFEDCAEPLMSQVRASADHYDWSYHGDADGLVRNRQAALDAFLADYGAGARAGRYVAAALPLVPFADATFDLALVSHFLFLYAELCDLEFHVASIRELCRVAGEVRIFPLFALDCRPSPHVPAAAGLLKRGGYRVEVVRVPYEFVRGANEMMRVTRIEADR